MVHLRLSRQSVTFVIAAASTLGLVAGIGARQTETFERWWGPHYSPRVAPRVETQQARVGTDTLGRLRHWNHIAIDATGLDHTPAGQGEPHEFGEHLGPGRASRAMAIVHIAIAEAMNAIDHRFESYLGIAPLGPGVSMDAALAQAAHDTLIALYASQRVQIDRALAEDLDSMPRGSATRAGVALGGLVAAAILERRADDGSAHDEEQMNVGYVPGNGPGEWRQDPISQLPVALGVHWGEVTPFVLPSVQSFRAPAPPRLDSAAYTSAFNEVKRVGGDGIVTPTERTEEQTLTGIFWAYDGTPSLCAPPRLYNQIAMVIADQMQSDVVDRARLLALINVAMADAAIAIWDSKYLYKFWRPVTGIREADPSTGPTRRGDSNPKTRGDQQFSPLAAPASNLGGVGENPPNFTPPFPAYPSGHAGFGGALFQILRKFYGTDSIPFTFVSDELNGVTVDNEGHVRPLTPRSFRTLSEAEEENGQSRIYLGIHWSFDKTEGIAQGRRVADYVFDHAFVPLAD